MRSLDNGQGNLPVHEVLTNLDYDTVGPLTPLDKRLPVSRIPEIISTLEQIDDAVNGDPGLYNLNVMLMLGNSALCRSAEAA